MMMDNLYQLSSLYNGTGHHYWHDMRGFDVDTAISYCKNSNVVESMLSNSSYFWAFYNFTHKNDWMSEYREKLWDDGIPNGLNTSP